MRKHSKTVNGPIFAPWSKKTTGTRIGSKGNLISKVVHAGMRLNKYRFGATNPFLGNPTGLYSVPLNLNPSWIAGGTSGWTGGAYALANIAGAGLATNQRIQSPLHIYELNCINNTTNNGTGVNPVTYPAPGYEMKLINDAGSSDGLITGVVFEPLYCKGADGVTVNQTWQQEVLESGPSGGPPTINAKCLLTNINMKFMLYGRLTQPTEFTISVVHLKEDWVQPDFLYSWGQVADAAAPYFQNATNFWQSMISHEVQHPINTIANKQSKIIKTLKTQKFIIQPKNGTEFNSDYPHVEEYTLNLKLNEIMDFTWAQNVILPRQEAAYGHDVWANQKESLACHVTPKKRLYVIIKATNQAVAITPGASIAVDHTPSYDLVMKQSFYSIA